MSSTPIKNATTPLGPTPSNIRPSVGNATAITTSKSCRHFFLTFDTNVRSAPEPSRVKPTSRLMCAPMTKVAHATFPAHIANTALTNATIWSPILSRSIRSPALRKNVYLGRVPSYRPMGGTPLGLYQHLTTTHSQSLPQLHPLLHHLRLHA